MGIPDSYVYGILIAIVSSVATLIASKIASKATQTSAESALAGITSQIEFQARVKIAEFRQAWINELRQQMATLQSLGVTPNAQHQLDQEFYKAGTTIELLMNRDDPNYESLDLLMYKFLKAETIKEKFACNAPFVKLCQDILKTEWEILKKDLQQFQTLKTHRSGPTALPSAAKSDLD